MIANEKKINRLFLNWLILSLIIVYFIIIVGGLTRLTNSGLSITEWNPVSGILPPFDQQSWDVEFGKYKQSPEYIKYNSDLCLLV